MCSKVRPCAPLDTPSVSSPPSGVRRSSVEPHAHTHYHAPQPVFTGLENAFNKIAKKLPVGDLEKQSVALNKSRGGGEGQRRACLWAGPGAGGVLCAMWPGGCPAERSGGRDLATGLLARAVCPHPCP